MQVCVFVIFSHILIPADKTNATSSGTVKFCLDRSVIKVNRQTATVMGLDLNNASKISALQHLKTVHDDAFLEDCEEISGNQFDVTRYRLSSLEVHHQARLSHVFSSCSQCSQ